MRTAIPHCHYDDLPEQLVELPVESEHVELPHKLKLARERHWSNDPIESGGLSERK